MSTALDTALGYAARGWRVFPIGSDRVPMIDAWPERASLNPAKLTRWRQRWPRALIGLPTGRGNGVVVLDIDCKSGRWGFDALDDLGFAILPMTPIAHTRSGGAHLYFASPAEGLRNTAGARGRGIGIGLDWRGDGGFVVLPAPGSGYWWDPHLNLGTVPLAPVPPALLPREPERPAATRPIRPALGLSPYAEAALDGACRTIIGAAAGEQRDTLNTESFSLGTLAGAGAIPGDFARRALHWAAAQLRSYDPQRPWRAAELGKIVDLAFEDGLRRPRRDHHGGVG